MTSEEPNDARDETGTPDPGSDGAREEATAGAGEPPAGEGPTGGKPPAPPDENSIRAELGITGGRRPIDPDHVEALLEEALAGCDEIAAATGEMAEPGGEPVRLSEVGAGELVDQNLELLRDVNLQVKVELGRGRMYLKDILRLGQGSVVELERLAGDPLDIYVNDKVIARGEVLVLNENFCIRITEVFNPEELRNAI